MNVSNALGFPAPVPTAKRSDSPKQADETDAPPSTERSAQFAAFLSMIVGTDPKLRADLKKQLPENTAGLLDRLLASTTETAPDISSAVDAAHYGLVTENARGAVATLAAPATTPASAPATPSHKMSRTEIIALNKARAAELLGTMNEGVTEPDDASVSGGISQSVLTRATSGKSSSLEELLAIGDHEAASVRAGLDNVLAKSGTDAGLTLAAAHAASSALSAALAASASNVATPIKDTEALDPELRARLERVVDRMKNEFGHDVSVVETVRSQARQDSLYAQGRTTPGAVVTWTTDSLHTQGEAVDVVVDGNWNDAKGFARLQQIAKEEGLNTLGAKDPGHLELPKDSWTMNANVRVTSAISSGQSSSGIAQVATVARVASVGAGMNIGPTQPEIPAVPQPTIATNGAAGLLQPRDSNNNAHSQNSADSTGEQSPRKSSLKSSDKTDARANNHAYQETPTDMKARFIGPVEETQRPSGAAAADAVDRVHDINDMREQQGAKPLSQITLEVDDVNGGKQQITVGVTGKVVDTHISADGTSADRMRAHVGELKTGLETRGLEADTVRISTQGARTDGLENAKHGSGAERDAMRMTGAGTSGGTGSNGDPSAQQGAREKSSTARDWEEKQAARDEQRAQNRDAQGRGSGNQDRQRPQYQEKK